MKNPSKITRLPQKETQSRSFLRGIFAFGILPNLLFWLLGTAIYLMRPRFNVDYLAAGCVISYLPRGIGILGFALLIVNELFVQISPIYHFQIVDAYRYIADTLYIHWTYSVPVGLVLLVSLFSFSICAVKIGWNPKNKHTQALVLCLMIFLAAVADITNGTSFIPIKHHLSWINDNIAYSGLRRTYQSLKGVKGTRVVLYEPLPFEGSASGALLKEIATGGSPLHGKNIVFVLMESLSLFQDPTMQKLLLEPILAPQLKQRYRIRSFTVPFEGHTIEGEFRELCGVKLTQYGEESFPPCLPHLLEKKGYETFGIHGFTSQFYNRYRWYPKLEFNHILFAPELKSKGVNKICGSAFKGICDASIAKSIGYELKSKNNPHPKPKFIYWLTLNSHLPLDRKTHRKSSYRCEQHPITEKSTGACHHSQVIHYVLSTLAAVANDPDLPPTQFIIVGDHTAPFISQKERSLYSGSHVPAVILDPK